MEIFQPISLLCMIVGGILIVLNQEAETSNWPWGGPAWRFYVGHTLAWGGFILMGLSVV